MPETPKHPRGELQDLLDGRLDSAAQAEVEQHLNGCDSCRRELDLLAQAKAAAATLPEVPEELERGILAALDGEDLSARISSGRQVHFVRWPRWAAAAAVAAAVAAAIFIVLDPEEPLPNRVAAEFTSYQEGGLRLDFESASAIEIETYLKSRNLPFRTRVIDLGMMSYALVGAVEHRVGDTAIAFMPYSGPAGQTLVCQMFEGRVEDLPKADEIRETDDFTFYIYRRDGVTLAFWQEGEVTCVLASDIDPELLIELAVAKAMKAA